MTSRLTLLAALLAALAAAPPAHAGSFWDPDPLDLEVEASEAETFEDLRELAEKYADESGDRVDDAVRAVNAGDKAAAEEHWREARDAAKLAIQYHDRALAKRPDEAELHYRCAALSFEWLYQYYDDANLTSMRDKVGAHAVEHWAHFERLSPRDPRRVAFIYEATTPRFPFLARMGYRPSSYQFRRALYYTKLGGEENFRKALQDYEFLVDAAPRTSRTAAWIAMLLTNSAEVRMALGELDEALVHYEEGVEWSRPGDESYVVHLFGFAVALDRAGERGRSAEVMAKALNWDPQIKQLSNPNYFFIPSGDEEYYYALAFEVSGNQKEALAHYRKFVERAPSPHYLHQAERHIEELEAALAGEGGKSGRRRK
jgi:tetratricopeptide (TPR) repeat protein